jgi:hypothetical protein
LSCLGLALALSGCLHEDDDYNDSRTRGDLGAGDFAYGCFNDTDITCADSDHGLPRAIAVGGRFDLRFAIKSGPQPTVIAPASDFVRTVEGGFQVRGAGEFALLAVNGNREVVDIKHLRGAEIEEVRVQEDDTDLPATTLHLDRHQAARLLAVPYGSRGVELGGALSYAWTSTDDSLVSIETLSALNRVRVRAGNKAGKGALQIDVAGKTFTVNVEIGPAEAAPEMQDAGTATDGSLADAQSDASDARSDANADADADADADAESDGGSQ